MSTNQIGWAPSNRWFAPGYENAFEYTIDEETIKIMPLPYFLGTKMEAFFDRGIEDLYISHDFEDIVYLLNYCSSLPNLILAAENNLKTYLSNCFKKMLENTDIMAAMPAHLYFEESEERMEIILEKMKIIIGEIQ